MKPAINKAQYCTIWVLISCESEISRIQLIVDLRVMDMLEFDVILRMDRLTGHRVIINCDRMKVTTYTPDNVFVLFEGDNHDALPQDVYYSRWPMQLMGWLASLNLGALGETGVGSTSAGL